MLEVKIPKEIMDYQEKFLMGLSIRKIISLVAAAFISVAFCWMLGAYASLPVEVSSYGAFALSIPVLAVGFIKIDGYNFEKHAVLVIKHYMSNPVKFYKSNPELSELKIQQTRRGRSQVENIFTITKKQEKRARKLSELDRAIGERQGGEQPRNQSKFKLAKRNI
jgi:hypothetical protein